MMKKNNQQIPHFLRRRKNSGGFTIVELLVAVSLFAIAISIAVGGFVSALRSERQIASLIAADNNLSLTLEQMAREIRTGYNFCRPGDNCYVNIPQNCSLPPPITTADELDFINAKSQPVTYRMSGESIVRDVIEDSSIGTKKTSVITSGNVSIRFLKFTLRGNASGDCWPPRITISVGVSSKDPTFANVVVNVETTISARQLDS